jgi:hypothetical protein
MLEGVKIVIERLQMDEPQPDWLHIAQSILDDTHKIFSEQEKNELRNVYRVARRKEFNADIIDAINKETQRTKKRPSKIMTTSNLQEEALKILNEEASKYVR